MWSVVEVAKLHLDQARGFAYRPLSDLLEAPLEDVLERVEASFADPATETAKALLGAVEEPALRLSGLVEEVERIAAHDNRYKSENQIPVDWITEKWFAPGAFDGTNDEARDILLISVETGCRQSEICDLPPEAIVLDHPIPHLRLKFEEGENRREIKNTSSVREVPLVGVALAAAKRHADGFPRYRGKSTYSATMNQYLRNNGLLPSSKHTIGGVRHTWESRILAETKRMDVSGEMMGHFSLEINNHAIHLLAACSAAKPLLL